MPTAASQRLAPPAVHFPRPYVLVADDDPASRRFFGDGLRALGARVHECDDGQVALARAAIETFDLLLLDCRMPGAGARDVLAALRADAEARSADALAVATSADVSAQDRQRLLAAGFSDVLLKPCPLEALRPLLTLARSSGRHAPLLDDATGLASSGDARTMHALRGLLREELAAMLRELDQFCANPLHLVERLHRVRSACGFCGAPALAMQATHLQRQVEADGSVAEGAQERFRQTLVATLAVLGRQAS
ncbi:response regulator [Frateuria terrea]|uniref:Response regulator receiver domain-containing protein n=1 Tax=Frateuria terrea TaxID=529704 RepID=A0A1H6ZU50_9GAMM|nr:response regulator [Frateuria terrea]SEJ56989.1 Response regulator receiver domain-containing protein [Frateuria terrea]SFP81636.1 Response regulator receiver domain-containing protein [Frateuria terrea]